MIAFAIIGTSWIAEEFFLASRCTDLTLRSIYSRDAQRGQAFAAKLNQPNADIFTSIEALALCENIQAIYVASPNSCHAAQCEILLRHGKHVLCEKPITVTPQELANLQNLAQEKNLIFMEAIMYLHTPARELAKKALKSLGNITTAHFDFSQRSSRYDALLRGELPNIFNPALAAGAFNDLGIYCVYPAIDFFGMPEKITSAMHMLHTGADGAGAAILHYPSKLITLTWSKLGQSRGVSQIMGNDGTLTIESISQFQGIALGEQSLAAPLKKFEIMQYEAQAFCDYILGRASRVSYQEACKLALQVSKIMEQVRNSA